MVDCIACGKAITEKDTIGINKKMLGENIRDYYCLDCLADYLECTTDELLEKIDEVKEEGCTLFK